MSKRKTAVFRAFCFFTAVFAVTMMQQSKIFAQEYNVTPAAPGTLEDYDTLLAENRKLAVALAETTESLLKMRAAGNQYAVCSLARMCASVTLPRITR